MNETAVWTDAEIDALAATPKAAAEARKLVAAGAFGPVERSADGTTWSAACRGSQGTYRVTVRREPRTRTTTFHCNCPSHQYPCKHALGLMAAIAADGTLSAPAAGPGGDFEALLRAVFHHPDDDTPRLVLADYLDDTGDAERAAFIRLQCRIARLKPRERGKRELIKEEAAAIARLKHFSATPNRLPTLPRYDRGFLHLPVWVWGAFVDSIPKPDELLRDGWVASVVLMGSGALRADWAGRLALAGEIDCRAHPAEESALLALAVLVSRCEARVATVRLRPADQNLFDRLLAATASDAPVAGGAGGSATRRYQGVSGADVRVLVRAGRLDGVRHLSLDGPIGDEGAAALAEATAATALRSLDLHGTRIGPAGGAALAASGYLSDLAAVQLFLHAMDDGWAALCDGGGLRGLVEFRAEGGNIGDAAASSIGRARHFTRWREMLWDSTTLTPAGAAAILGSPHLPALRDVMFNGNLFAPDVCLRLAVEAADRPALKLVLPGLIVHRRARKDGIELTADGTAAWGERLTTEMIEGFARSPAAKRVAALALTGFRFTPAALRTLAAALDPDRVRSLAFSGGNIGNAGAAAVADAFAAFRPTRLAVTDANLRRGGAEALAASPLTERVADLDLSRNALGAAGVEAFAGRAAGLKAFNVFAVPLTAPERRRLKKQFPGLTT